MALENAYFYIDFPCEDSIFSKFSNYAKDKKKQIYVLKKALATNNTYPYNHGCAVLIPNCKIIIVNLREEDNDDFDAYFEDFIADIDFLSKKYEYREVLGRPREWTRNEFIKKYIDIDKPVEDIVNDIEVKDRDDRRKIELLTSLVLGNINDIERIGNTTPIETLDKVKRKIILFDTDQNNFIYRHKKKKEVRIQGLAGTGKTELILHKIKELYVKECDCSIVFTCYNNVLKDDMYTRIIKFFNFMKVEEQIEWNKRLWVMRAWGSGSDYSSGVYSFICNRYKIYFYPFGKDTPKFDNLCKEVVNILKSNEGPIEPCFDYIFIDESQDFGEGFFELCSMVTRKQVFIAGDIFQNIFETNISTANADFILSRCYRTEPKTLMFAHAIGMGLYENPPLRWLDDSEWNACGYIINKDNGKYFLHREPIRRFEDIETGYKTFMLTEYDNNDIIKEIEKCINNIKNDNPSVAPDDIAIIFIESNMYNNYQTANSLENMLCEKFNWSVNKGYETKKREENTLFISNINNIKGLEFPFVLVISEKKITNNFRTRNSIYMALTRSLIKSYFFINKTENEQFIKIYTQAMQEIDETNKIIIQEPSEEQKEIIKTNLLNKENEVVDLIQEVMDELFFKYGLTPEQKNMVINFSRESFPKSINKKEIKDRMEKVIQAMVR